MKKPNQLIALIFSILLILLFVSCPGATGVMYSLTLSCPDATESGTTVLYYSSIEDAWYGDVSATQRATKIEVPEKKYTIKFRNPNTTDIEYTQVFNGYYIGGVEVVDKDGTILDTLKPTRNMTAIVSWVDGKIAELPEAAVGENQEFEGWKEEGAQDSSAMKGGESYTPTSPTTTLEGVVKNLSQYKITLNPGPGVSDENKGTTEIWYNAYDGKFYNGKNKDPKNPGDAADEEVVNPSETSEVVEQAEGENKVEEIITITTPKISRTIKYITNPDNARDIDDITLSDVPWESSFQGYVTQPSSASGNVIIISGTGTINTNVIIDRDIAPTPSWSNTQKVRLETIETDGYTFLGWREVDGTEILVGSSEFQGYTPKIENNELRAIWASNKTWTLTLSHDGATSKQFDRLFFKVADSGSGGTWFKEYGNEESKIEALLETDLPQKVSTITLDLQNGSFNAPPEEGEDDIDRTNVRSVKWTFGGYLVRENGLQFMVINANGEFKDENGNPSAIYNTRTATASWTVGALSLPTNNILTRAGYTLTGWKDSKGTVYKDTYTPDVTKETLIAVWTPNVYTLKLNLNDNEFTSRGDESVYYRTDDRWYSMYTDGVKRDSNGVIVPPARVYTISYSTGRDAIVYGNDRAVYKFLGYYDANDECYIDGNGRIVKDKILTSDPSVAIEVTGKWEDANLELPIPIVQGYTFRGWREGESESYPKVPELYNPTSDVRLYAIWNNTVYSASLKYDEGCGDTTLIKGVEYIALNNGEGASVRITLDDKEAKFSSSLNNENVKKWFIYKNEQGTTNDFGSNLPDAEITIKNGGPKYNYVTVLIKGCLVLPYREDPITTMPIEYSTNIVIPQSDIVNAYSGNVMVPMKYQVGSRASMSIEEATTSVGTEPYPIMGSMNAPLGDKSTGVTLVVKLENAVFSDELDTDDIEDWFNGLSLGLGGSSIKYRMEEGGRSQNYVKISISGVPQQRERGKRVVTIPFKDLKGGNKGTTIGSSSLTTDVYYDTKYFQKAFEINLTSDEQGKAKEDWSGVVRDQNMSFILLPGGVDWPVVWSGTSATPAATDTATIREDVAIADIEVTGGFFMTVLKWAEENGYNFNLIRSDSSNTTSTPIYSLGYNGANKNSSLDPVVGVSWYNAIVFCNAVTEWYNATKNPVTPLTCAYVVGGVSGGTPIRDANYTNELDKIDPKQHLPLSSDYYSHVVGSTGFRLPTRTEWLYAASVSPTKVDETKIKPYPDSEPGLVVPPPTFFAQAYDTISGKNANFSSNGTREVGKYVEKENANLIGLYDMSGNAFEWAEDLEAIGYRYLNGGGWNSGEAECKIGSYVRRVPTLNATSVANETNTGFRLCRNIFNNF